MGLTLHNEFTVDASIDRTWAALQDVPAVGGCLPGAVLDPEPRDGAFAGRMKVKLGPVVSEYTGSARLVDQDEQARTIRYEVTGKEARGQGSASALISSRLSERGGATLVAVDTDLSVTGRPAQFGRGIMQDVAGAILDEFAAALSNMVSAGPDGGPRAASGGATSAFTGDEALDVSRQLMGVLGKRALAIGGCVAVVGAIVAGVVLRRRGRAAPYRPGGPPWAAGPPAPGPCPYGPGGWRYVPAPWEQPGSLPRRSSALGPGRSTARRTARTMFW